MDLLFDESSEEPFLETDWIQEFEKIVDEGIYYPCEPMFLFPIYSLIVEKNTIIHISKKNISFPDDLRGEGGGGVGEQGGSRNILPYLQKISAESYWMEWMKEYTEFVGCDDALKMEEMRLEKRAKSCVLSDVLLFNVDSVVDDLDGGGEGELAGGSFFQSYSLEEWKSLDKLLWKDSVFLFHSINCVYFIFRTVEVVPIPIHDVSHSLHGESLFVEMPVDSAPGLGGVSGGVLKKDLGSGSGSSHRGTMKVRFWEDDMLVGGEEDAEEEDNGHSSSSEDGEEEEEEWGKGKWIRNRRKKRRKTEKRKHVLSPAFIRSLFDN